MKNIGRVFILCFTTLAVLSYAKSGGEEGAVQVDPKIEAVVHEYVERVKKWDEDEYIINILKIRDNIIEVEVISKEDIKEPPFWFHFLFWKTLEAGGGKSFILLLDRSDFKIIKELAYQ